MFGNVFFWNFKNLEFTLFKAEFACQFADLTK